MYDNADTFKSFDIDASDFTNDIHIGFRKGYTHLDFTNLIFKWNSVNFSPFRASIPREFILSVRAIEF